MEGLGDGLAIDEGSSHTRAVVYVKLLLTALFWGGTFVSGRVIAQVLSPFAAAFLRFSIASLIFAAYLALRPEPRPRLSRAQWLQLVILGITGVVTYNLDFFRGLQTITASRAAMLIATSPLAVSLASAYFFRERLTPLKLLAVALALLGALTVLSYGDFSSLWREGIGVGELWMLGCVTSWVVYTLVGKMVMTDLSPMLASAIAVWIGTAGLLPLALGEGLLSQWPALTAAHWFHLAFLGMFGTVLGFIWYYTGVRALGAPLSALFMNFVPVCAVALATVFLHERVSPSFVLGAGLVVAGVALSSLSNLKLRRPSKKLGMPGEPS